MGDKRPSIKKGILLAVFILFLLSVPSCVPLYHDKEIRGRVVDAETGEPIEGALVVAKWALSGLLHSEPGGYAKSFVIKTDDDGKFQIPSWITFKPKKLYYHVDQSINPRVVIYKPGYETYSANKAARTGYRDDQSMTQKEKEEVREKYSITPARLARTHTDEELWENYRAFESGTDFPDRSFSQRQLGIMFDVIEREISQMPGGKNKHIILRNLKTFKKSYL